MSILIDKGRRNFPQSKFDDIQQRILGIQMKTPDSESKEDYKMKRFFVFTLVALFATTGLFLTDLYAFNSDFRPETKFAGNVYGSTYVATWFDTLTETAHSSHSVAIDNYGPGEVKLYGTFTVTVRWNGGSTTPPAKEKEKNVDGNSFGSAHDNFSFLLRNKPEGKAKITAWTELEVRDLATKEKVAWTTAQCSTRFEL